LPVDLRWEPGAGNPHAGFCPGGGPKGPSLPGYPAIRRFLTPDPYVTDPLGGQSYNRYSYVVNNPTNLIDPSGFYGVPPNSGCIGVECEHGGGWDGTVWGDGEWIEAGVKWITPSSGTSAPRYPSGVPVTASEDRRPISLPTGPSAPAAAMTGPAPQASTAAAGDDGEPKASWKDHRVVQTEGGFLAGLAIGFVPGAAVGVQVLTAEKVIDPGTRRAQIGRAIGEIVGGIGAILGGATGEVLGGGISMTGIGAAIGVPAIAVSSVVVVGGIANVGAGFAGLADALMSKGSASGIRISSPNWKPRAAADPACRNGCESVARQIQKQIGGEMKRITPPRGARLGPFGGKDWEWNYHEVVVKDGRVYDAFTGGQGLPIDKYKELWLYANGIDFGF
jgi:hypothetical protein